MTENTLENVLTDEVAVTDAQGTDLAEKGEGQPKQEEQPKQQETQQGEDKTAALVKRWKDVAASSKGELTTLAKTVKMLADEGLVDFDDIAGKVGVDAKTIQNIVNGRGVQNPIAEAEKSFNQQYSLVKPLLAKTMQTNPDEVLKAFDWLTRSDPEVLDEFVSLPDHERVTYVMEKGQEYLPDFQEATSTGGNAAAYAKKLRDENARLKAELEALKAGKAQSNDVVSEPVSQPEGNLSLTAGALPKPTRQNTAVGGDFASIF